jgi:prepilin peptidase CpaA
VRVILIGGEDLITIALLSLLVISLYTDLKYRLILNVVTFPAILFGFIYYTFIDGINGIVFSGMGFTAGFLLFVLPFVMGGMGAGDVKLMAAIGSLMGANFVFNAFIYTCLVGGVISLGLVIWNKQASQTLNRIKLFPYGPAIVMGTLISFFWGGYV